MRAPVPSHPSPRLELAGDWLIAAGLAGLMVWTTLGLGGYRPETMVPASGAVWILAALGAVLGMLRAGATANLAAFLALPFVAWVGISACWIAPARWLGVREALLWLQGMLVFWLVLHFVRRRGPTALLVGTLVALGLAGAAMAAWQHYHDQTWLMLGRRQAPQFYGRSAGMFGAPNSLAGLLELLIPPCLTLAWSRATSPLAKVVCGWLAAIFGFALMLSGSRGGWLAVVGTLVLWAALFPRTWKWRLAGMTAIAVAAGLALVALFRFSPQVHDRMVPFLTGEFERSRPILWRAAVEIWRRSPWVGTGAASYNVLFDEVRPRGFHDEPQWTHNDYLNTLSDYGLVGFVAAAMGGGGLLWLGWRAVRRVRREMPVASGLFARWRWRQGLWLGLVAFSIHLLVDFHTKIPALLFTAAIASALLLRDEPALLRVVPPAWRWLGAPLALVILAVGGFVGAPAYRAEALRYGWRQRLDAAVAGPPAGLDLAVPQALESLEQAVAVDSANAQAWSDLSWATALTWHVTHGDLGLIGKRSETAAQHAVQICPVLGEFWVRKGVALDMQARHDDAEALFRRAIALAPNRADWHYALAYHLNALSGREREAREELETCLALDPENSAAVSLRARLKAGR